MSLGPLVSQYLLALQAEGVSPHTLRWHRQSLKQFDDWLAAGDHPQDPAEWTPTVLRGFIVYTQTRPSARGAHLSGAAVNSRIRSLRAFCAWLREERFVDRDLFERVPVPKSPHLVKETLSPSDIQRLLAALQPGGRNVLRDEALLLFLLDTGARANEVCTLRAEAIDWDRGIAQVFGKGRKERYVPFSPPTARAMQRYALRERKGHSNRFFESEEGAPLTPSGLFQMCTRLSRRAGVKLAPHKCRHTFGIQYLRNGGSVFALQKTLGHTSLDTTLRYAAMVTDDLINEHREHSPIAGLLGAKRRVR